MKLGQLLMGIHKEPDSPLTYTSVTPLTLAELFLISTKVSGELGLKSLPYYKLSRCFEINMKNKQGTNN